MKKLIYLFLTVLIVGCSSEDGGNDGDNNNSNNVNYFFEVEIGGEIFRVQGNTEDQASTPISLTDWFLYNKCVGSTDGVEFSITDITRDNFISGQNMNFGSVSSSESSLLQAKINKAESKSSFFI